MKILKNNKNYDLYNQGGQLIATNVCKKIALSILYPFEITEDNIKPSKSKNKVTWFSDEVLKYYPELKTNTALGYYDLTSGKETKFDSFLEEIETDLRNHKKHNKRTVEKAAATYGITNKNIVKETTELAIVKIARSVATQKNKSDYDKYLEIVELYKHQVNLSHRTSQSMLLQQYSTPAPIGYIGGLYILKKNNSEAHYFEPSAGNGLLTIALPIRNTIVNEIDDIRLQNLRTQDFEHITSQDATIPFTEYYKKFNGVITNPPFGTLLDAVDYDGFRIKTLDHLMALRTLDTMKDNGKAAIIIGGHTNWDDKGRIQAGKNRLFFNYLYSRYNVDDVILIDGHKLYSRQGTAFDVRLILIDGRKEKTEGFAPLKNKEAATVIYDFEDLWYRVFGSGKKRNDKARKILAKTPKKTREKVRKYADDLANKDKVKQKRIRIAKVKAQAKLKLLNLTDLEKLLGLGSVSLKKDEEKKKIYVYSEYNPEWVSAARKMNGKWTGNSWSFDIRDEDDIKNKLTNIFGTYGEKNYKTVDVLLFLDKMFLNEKSLFMFGRQIYHTWGRDSRVVLGEGVGIMEGDLSSSGSRKNYYVHPDKGTVLRIRDIPAGLIDKEDSSLFKIIEDKDNTDKQKRIRITKTKAQAKLKLLNLLETGESLKGTYKSDYYDKKRNAFRNAINKLPAKYSVTTSEAITTNSFYIKFKGKPGYSSEIRFSDHEPIFRESGVLYLDYSDYSAKSLIELIKIHAKALRRKTKIIKENVPVSYFKDKKAIKEGEYDVLYYDTSFHEYRTMLEKLFLKNDNYYVRYPSGHTVKITKDEILKQFIKKFELKEKKEKYYE